MRKETQSQSAVPIRVSHGQQSLTVATLLHQRDHKLMGLSRVYTEQYISKTYASIHKQDTCVASN